jgi:hypothetical protein
VLPGVVAPADVVALAYAEVLADSPEPGRAARDHYAPNTSGRFPDGDKRKIISRYAADHMITGEMRTTR